MSVVDGFKDFRFCVKLFSNVVCFSVVKKERAAVCPSVHVLEMKVYQF